GKISPTMAKHVQQGLDGLIEAVIDGGACTVGVESTIVGCVDGHAVLLRPGGVSVEDIAHVIGYTPEARGDADPISAPGQLSSHYAPDAAVSLNVTTPAPDQVWVGFGPDCADAELNLSPTGDLTEAAANLFQMLRRADEIADGARRIAFAPVPNTGLGLAINDRLRRAAAPRDQA
ncbi:MAG: Sua5 family C-terminal domain-containing protein, partial [Pseudomonadota bacterium]|nr:Sua5 family C-terminal domain-containing protein [Pseudomonadota bacterium]